MWTIPRFEVTNYQLADKCAKMIRERFCLTEKLINGTGQTVSSRIKRLRNKRDIEIIAQDRLYQGE